VSHGIVNRPGYLYVRSSENAEVFESSRSLGHTPIMDHELPAGHHVLHLVSPNGSRDVSVDIQPGVSAMLTIRW
jgi:hypothetical protein